MIPAGIGHTCRHDAKLKASLRRGEQVIHMIDKKGWPSLRADQTLDVEIVGAVLLIRRARHILVHLKAEACLQREGRHAKAKHHYTEESG
jgi:hypothetical protein